MTLKPLFRDVLLIGALMLIMGVAAFTLSWRPLGQYFASLTEPTTEAPLTGAISTTLLDIRNFGTSGAPTISSNTITPTASSLLMICIQAAKGSGAGSINSVSDTLSGTGTWSKVAAIDNDTIQNTKSTSIWVAQAGSSPGSGVITATLNASHDRRKIHVYEVTGFDITDPVGATGTNVSSTNSLTVTLSASPPSDSLVMGCVTARDDGSPSGVTGDVDFIEGADTNNAANTSFSLQSQIDNSGADITVGWTALTSLTGGIRNIGVAVEIKASTGSPPPSLPITDIKANGSDGPITIPYNTSTTISWTSTDATSCVASPGGWGGVSGSQSTGALTSSQIYTANCDGAGGTAQDSVTVNVEPPPPASPSTYYISPTGSDTNDGLSTGTAWQTIDKVNATTFNSGDTILFEGGAEFFGKLSFNSSDTGSLTISSYGTGRATIRAGTEGGFSAYNLGNISVSSLNFVGDGVGTNIDQGISFYTDLPGDVKLGHVYITDVEVSGFGKMGIVVGAWNGQTGYRDVRIVRAISHDNLKGGIQVYGQSTAAAGYAHEDVYVGYSKAYNNVGDSNNSPSGIVVSDLDGGVIEHSIAYNNGSEGSGGSIGMGIWTWDANNVVIQHNESYGNHTNGATDGHGFDLDGGVTNSVMQYNYSHDNDGAGYAAGQYSGAPLFSHNTVRYNISQNDGRKNGRGGIHFFRASDTAFGGAEIYNNVVYMSPSSSGSPRAMWIKDPTENVHLRNNILITTGNLPLVEIGPGQVGLVFQNNSYWPSGETFNIQWNGTLYTSLDAWRAATGQEMVSGSPTGFSIDPRLTNQGGGGTIGDTTLLPTLSAYRLLSDSILIDAGLHLQNLFGTQPGTRDFYGSAIPVGDEFDVGAHDSEGSLPPTIDIHAMFLGKTGEDFIGTGNSSIPNGVKEFHIQLKNTYAAITKIRISNAQYAWEWPYNGTDWGIYKVTTTAFTDLWLEPRGSAPFSLTAHFNDGTVATTTTNVAAPSAHHMSVVSSIQDAKLTLDEGIHVRGNYAYVTANAADRLNVISIANPLAPVIVGSVQDSLLLDGAEDIFVQDNYAYVTIETSVFSTSEESIDRLTIVDIASSTNPTVVGSVQDHTLLKSTEDVFAANGYVYVTAEEGDRLTIIDATNPSSPVIVGSVYDQVKLDGAEGLWVEGNYAYVVTENSHRLTIVDVSNPTNPVIVSSVASSSLLYGASGLFLSGNYAYVAAEWGGRITIIDVANPANPVIVGSIKSDYLSGTDNLDVIGNYAYATSAYGANGKSVAMIDVSDKAKPYIAGYVQDAATLKVANGIRVVAPYVFVTAEVSLNGDKPGRFTVVNIPDFTATSTDTISPTVTITKPLNNATLPQTGSFTITANAQDATVVSLIELYIDETVIHSCVGSKNCSKSYPTSGITSGPHTIVAKAYDAEGNMSSTQITVVK